MSWNIHIQDFILKIAEIGTLSGFTEKQIKAEITWAIGNYQMSKPQLLGVTIVDLRRVIEANTSKDLYLRSTILKTFGIGY